MTPPFTDGNEAQWNRLGTLFEAVLSLPSGERAAFLEATCGSDPALRSEIESLVAAHDGAPEFLDAFRAEVIQPVLGTVSPVARDDAPADLSQAGSGEGSRIRHFTVHEQLGRGGAGVVHRGRDTLLARDVAMKFLSPELHRDTVARDRLVREAQAASRLEDPNVCAIHAIETTVDGGLCIVMAYCAGGTLRDALKREALPTSDLRPIAVQLARGLATAHREGIVHGDIKPANIGFAEGGVVRLLDFGIAGPAHDAGSGERLSGTLPYLAPELWRGGARSPRSDVWALGVTFFEMVTRRRPFADTEPSALAEAILGDPVPPIVRPDGSRVDDAFETLIRQMLSKDAAQRPADGREVLDALLSIDAVHAAPMVSARREPDVAAPRAPTTSRASDRRTLIAVGALATALLAWVVTRPRAVREAAPVEVARTATPISSIAVLPFTVRGGDDLTYLANGMVDLLTPAFDGTGLVRGIDPNSVIGAAGDRASGTLDSAAARNIAAQLRADRYVVGSVVQTGATLAFRATLRRIDGSEVGRAQTTVATSNGLTAGIDDLVRQLISTELLAPGDTVAGIAAATTTSSRALRAYLDGERELRDARPASAVAQFQAAVAADPQFALAWYRLARAARWSDVDSLSAAAARRADQLAGTLPPRQQALVRAYHTLRFGSPLQAERQFAQITSDYPTDVEAWMLLGEVRFGNNPYHGRPIAESADAFQRVMALDPRNREVTVYLMDLAAAAHRTGQLDTLFTMYFSPNSAGEQPGIRATYLDLYRRRVRPTASGASQPSAEDNATLARVALSRITADTADRRAAQVYASLLSNAASSRLEGAFALAALRVADGQWDASEEIFRQTAALDPDATIEHRALFALAPSAQVPPLRLRELRQELGRRRTPRSGGPDDLTPAEHDDVRQYLIGVLSARLGDDAGVRRARAELLSRRVTRSRVAAPLADAVSAHGHLSRDDAGAALAAFERSVIDLPARLRQRAPVLQQHVDRLGRATALRRLGRDADADRWQRSVGEGAGVTGLAFAGGVPRAGAAAAP